MGEPGTGEMPVLGGAVAEPPASWDGGRSEDADALEATSEDREPLARHGAGGPWAIPGSDPRGGAVPDAPADAELLTWRSVLAAPAVAITTLVAGLVATDHAGVSFRDPDHVAAKYIVLVGFAVFLLVRLDIAVRAAAGTGSRRPTREAMRRVRRERWGPYRSFAALGGLLSFYLAYLSYGNVKSVVPLLRPGDLFDQQLADIDRALFLGHNPNELTHTLLGAGFQTHVMSVFYVAFIVFLPLSLALSLVFTKNLRGGLFVATALSANWLIGAASYVALPALGPIYAFPAEYAHLPASGVTTLQNILLENRTEFLRDPDAPGTGQAIAAFVSLHTSMTFTAAVAAHLLGLGRRLRIALWVVVVVTMVGTVYLGWHYVIDDIGGIAVALLALLLARLLTGIDLKQAREGTAGRGGAPGGAGAGSVPGAPGPAGA